jgi:hypothetical protein
MLQLYRKYVTVMQNVPINGKNGPYKVTERARSEGRVGLASGPQHAYSLPGRMGTTPFHFRSTL